MNDDFDCQMLLQIPQQAAIGIIRKAGFIDRILSKDNTQFIATRDYRKDRINLRIVNGLVSEARIG